MWKSTVELDRPQMTIQRTACCIPTARHTHSEYVILIDFPPQKWLRKRAATLRYTYIACLVPFNASLLVKSQSSHYV